MSPKAKKTLSYLTTPILVAGNLIYASSALAQDNKPQKNTKEAIAEFECGAQIGPANYNSLTASGDNIVSLKEKGTEHEFKLDVIVGVKRFNDNFLLWLYGSENGVNLNRDISGIGRVGKDNTSESQEAVGLGYARSFNKGNLTHRLGLMAAYAGLNQDIDVRNDVVSIAKDTNVKGVKIRFAYDLLSGTSSVLKATATYSDFKGHTGSEVSVDNFDEKTSITDPFRRKSLEIKGDLYINKAVLTLMLNHMYQNEGGYLTKKTSGVAEAGYQFVPGVEGYVGLQKVLSGISGDSDLTGLNAYAGLRAAYRFGQKAEPKVEQKKSN